MKRSIFQAIVNLILICITEFSAKAESAPDYDHLSGKSKDIDWLGPKGLDLQGIKARVRDALHAIGRRLPGMIKKQAKKKIKKGNPINVKEETLSHAKSSIDDMRMKLAKTTSKTEKPRLENKNNVNNGGFQNRGLAKEDNVGKNDSTKESLNISRRKTISKDKMHIIPDAKICTPKKSIKKCNQCVNKNQCMDGFCCPYMRLCVLSSSMPCPTPAAKCRPMCFDEMDQSSCTCENKDFPLKWAQPTCEGETGINGSYSRSIISSGIGEALGREPGRRSLPTGTTVDENLNTEDEKGSQLGVSDPEEEQGDALEEIPYLHEISPPPGPGEYCSQLEENFKAISFIKVVNEVRKKNGLNEIATDNNLCYVALLHGYDQFVNNPVHEKCSLHSWSDIGIQSAGYNWSSCCYTGGDDGKCMWDKPFEILMQTKNNAKPTGKARSINIDLAPSFSNGTRQTNGIPHGFEISIGPVGSKDDFADYDDAEEKESIDGWMNSPKHKAVILNEGIWKEMKWTKIGGAAYGPFANVWFSE